MRQIKGNPEYRRTIFDGIFPRFYGFTSCLFTFWQGRRVRREAVNALGLRPGQKAIDIACGTGEMTIPLAEKVGKSGSVLGIDLSQKMMDVAQKKSRNLPQVSFSVRDFINLGCKNFYNAAAIGFAAKEVPRDIRLKMYIETYNALRKGGKFLVLDITWPKNVIQKPFVWLFFKLLEPTGFDYVRENHKKVLESIGFKRICQKVSMFFETSVYQKP